MLLEPSEEPFIDSMTLAEVLQEAFVPVGVFNLVNGYGSVVAKASAETVKKVG